MEAKTLERIGLTKGEIRAYLALLKMGPGPAGAVAKNAEVSRSKIYLILDKLEKKGMASHVEKSGVHHFQAVEPSKIKDYLKEKREELEGLEQEFNDFLPRLESYFRQQGARQNVTIYQGFRGLRVAHEHIYLKLKKGDEYYALGAPETGMWKPLDWFWERDHRRRAKEGIGCKILFNANVSKNILRHRNSQRLCEARYMPTGMMTPAEIEVYKDTTLIITISAEPISIEIVSQEIADSFRSYFGQFWKRSKPFG
jgi:predicted transcriptional regulator